MKRFFLLSTVVFHKLTFFTDVHTARMPVIYEQQYSTFKLILFVQYYEFSN